MPHDPPEWIQSFANAVAEQIVPVDVLPPLGCHCLQVDKRWEVTLFAAVTEVVGGPRDGERRSARFTCNVLQILRLFDEISHLDWQTHQASRADELGSHISVNGMVQGKRVWLRVLARQPKRFEAGRLARVNDRSWEEVW